MSDYEATAREATRVDADKFARDSARVNRGFWPKVRRLVGRIEFVEDAVAAYYCARDPQTPFRVKAVIMGALAYFVLPVDVVPDVLAVFGFVDDAAVLGYAYRFVASYVTDRHRDQARAALHDLDPSPESHASASSTSDPAA
jgi:uncharacterized membrane protein YkvA (DUF1232 family)